jgi:hypothetical protein
MCTVSELVGALREQRSDEGPPGDEFADRYVDAAKVLLRRRKIPNQSGWRDEQRIEEAALGLLEKLTRLHVAETRIVQRQ